MKKILAIMVSMLLICIAICPMSFITSFAETPTITGTTYYVSNNGSDSNNGLTPETAWQSVAKVNSASLSSGDGVLFARGGEWRGTKVRCVAGVTYGAYGTGDAPILNGSARNYADSSLWLATGTSNVYKLNVAFDSDVGSLVFNDGENWGIKINGGTADLKKDLAFCYADDYAYLYSAEGNPGTRFDSIEVVTCDWLMAAKNNNNIDGIAFKYGNFGIATEGSTTGIHISNCDFFGIGGCDFDGSLRYGNAIEFNGNVSNVSVDSCTFSQIFDTAITTQSNTYATVNGVTITNNTIDKCHWGMEYWTQGGSISNLLVDGNTFTNTAEGWSANQRWNGFTVTGAHISDLGYTNFTKQNCVISNNTFGTSGAMMLKLTGSGWTLSGNTYRQYDGKRFGSVNSSEYKFNDAFITDTLPTIDATATAEVVSTGNLIVNGDFEDGTTGWTVQDGGSDWRVAIDDFHSHVRYTGFYALRVRHQWSNTSQTVTVEPNRDYNYSFWCMRTAGGSTTTVTIGSETIALTDTVGFVEYSGTVNSGSASSMQIAIGSDGGGAETYTYFDDFSLIAVPLAPEEIELVTNGSFENGTTGWTVSNPGNDWNVEVDTYAGHANSGSNALHVRHFWSSTTQSIAVEPNTDYRYSFWCRRTAGGSTTTVSIGSETVELAESAGYVEYTGTVNSGASSSLLIAINSNGGGGDTNTYFDDFSLKFVPKAIEEIELVANGGFENGTDSWTVSHPGNEWNVEVDSYAGHAHTGSNSLHVRHFWSYTTQSVAVEPNTNYRYRFWCSRTAGGSTTTVSFGSETITLAEGAYTEYTGIVNSGNSDTLTIAIFSNGGGGDTNTYLDDFSLKYVSEVVQPVSVLNEGFETGADSWTISHPGNEWNVEVDTYDGHAHTGTNSLRIRHFWSYTTKSVAVEPNTDYGYSFWCRRTAGGSTTTVTIGSEVITLTDSAEYVEYTGTVNSGDSDTLTIAIFSDGGGGDTYTYLDDFVIEKDISVFGDITDDGVLDAADVLAMKAYLLASHDSIDTLFDLNEDSVADVRDLVCLKKAIADQ